MTEDITLQEAIATSPAWVRAWITWMNIAVIGSFVAFAIWRKTWIDAAVLLVVSVAMVVTMMMLYANVGFVRLLGLPHLIWWTPLVAYFVWRLRKADLPRVPRVAMMVLAATLTVSLAFDAVDVIRWLMGERGSMLPG